jgi:hypothetical protein
MPPERRANLARKARVINGVCDELLGAGLKRPGAPWPAS